MTTSEEPKGRYLRREFSYTKFQQTLVLPEDIESSKIEAKVTDGVLCIKIRTAVNNGIRIVFSAVALHTFNGVYAVLVYDNTALFCGVVYKALEGVLHFL